MKTAVDFLDELDQHVISDARDKSKVERVMESYADQFKPKWISVNDSLPEIDTEVLAYTKDEYLWLAFYTIVGWRLSYQPYAGDATIKTVTHWMPLPGSPNV